jgi:hypothetical protein
VVVDHNANLGSVPTPVLFIVFNRPDLTRKVFETIRKVKPSKLFVAADGPRVDYLGEEKLCAEVREITTSIDWDCEVRTRFHYQNLGCKRAVSSAITWFFENVEEGIILEDDCLPHPTFFRFCEELLEKYRYDDRIAQISGSNFLFGRKRTNYSYYFSRYTHIWGWASWRRAWKYYDEEMKIWPVVCNEGWLKDILGNRERIKYWRTNFQETFDGKINTWDYQWNFACLLQNALSIMPNVNLTSNIGFGPEASHTKSGGRFENMKLYPMEFPLQHPPFLIRDAQSDKFTDKVMFTYPLINKIKTKIKRLIRME